MESISQDVHHLAFAMKMFPEFFDSDSDIDSSIDIDDNNDEISLSINDWESEGSQPEDEHEDEAKEEEETRKEDIVEVLLLSRRSSDRLIRCTSSSKTQLFAKGAIGSLLQEAKVKAQRLCRSINSPEEPTPSLGRSCTTSQELCAKFYDSASSTLSFNAQCA